MPAHSVGEAADMAVLANCSTAGKSSRGATILGSSSTKQMHQLV
jgi:hypothetical protein